MTLLPFDFHSPVETITLPAGIRIDVKRDDMIHPFISGNKWRKLKYVLADARERGKHHIVTFGGAWSNHLLATACAGARFGFKTTAFVRGEEVINPVLALCRTFGMQLCFVSREAYKDKHQLYLDFSLRHDDTYFIDEGGYGQRGAQGCAEILSEADKHYDHIFCACGTGTTLAGLVLGAARHQLSTRIHGVPVLKNGGYLMDEITELAPCPTIPVTLHTEYHFGGYAKYNDSLLQFVREFSSHTGVLIEPVYTGKMFYALNDLAVNGFFKPESHILAIHTGGLTGILGMYEQLASLK